MDVKTIVIIFPNNNLFYKAQPGNRLPKIIAGSCKNYRKIIFCERFDIKFKM